MESVKTVGVFTNIHLPSVTEAAFDQTLKETGYKHGYEFSKPHEHDEVIRCESSGQQRKLIRVIFYYYFFYSLLFIIKVTRV